MFLLYKIFEHHKENFYNYHRVSKFELNN